MKKNKRLLNLVNQAVVASFVKGKLSKHKFDAFLSSFKKLPSTDSIFALTEYKKGIKRELSKGTLEVESSVKLSTVDLAKLKKRFKIYDLRFKINKDLLGGLRLRLGDTVYDDSVNSKIEKLKEVVVSS